MKVLKRKVSFYKFFCKLLVVSFVFYFLFVIFSQFNKVRVKRNLLDNLSKEIRLYEVKRARLSSSLDVKDSEMERAARERGFSKKNEKVFVVSEK